MTFDFPAHSLVSESNNDVVFLHKMLEEAEAADTLRKTEKAKSWAGEIWEDSAKVRAFLSLKLDKCSPYDVMQGSTNEDEGGIHTWLDTIREKDNELKKASEQKGKITETFPPIRNSSAKEKKIQTGTIQMEKKSEAIKEESKNKRLYSYDYFKEWDKFDVDNELKRLEEEEKRIEEERKSCPKTADPGEDVHSDKTYQINAMSPLERRVAAQREKEKGNECMKCGEFNAAVAYYSKSLELVPGDYLVLGNRSQAYLNIHCYLQAELDCDKALSIEPTYTKARFRRAVARKEQGNWAGSLEDLERVLVENVAHSQAEKLRKECLLKLAAKQKEEEEKKREEEERQRYERAPRHKIAIHEVEGDDDDDDGMDKKALDKAREAVRLKNEAEEKLLRREAAQRKKDEGNEAFKAKDLAKAAALYSEAISLYPSEDNESYVALSNRALVYLQQGKYTAAEADCDKAIACNPKWAKAFHRRGVARAALNRSEDALKDLESALKLEPNSQQTLEEIRKLRQVQRGPAPTSGFAFSKSSCDARNGRPSMVELDSQDFEDKGGTAKRFEVLDDEIRPSISSKGMPARRIEIIDDDEDDAVLKMEPKSSAVKMNRIQIVEDDESDDEEAPDHDSAGQMQRIQIEEVKAHESIIAKDLQRPTEEILHSSTPDDQVLAALESQNEEGEILDDYAPTLAGGFESETLSGETMRVSVEEDSDDDDNYNVEIVDEQTKHVAEAVDIVDAAGQEVPGNDDQNTKDSDATGPISYEAGVFKGTAAPELWGAGEERDFESIQKARAEKENGDQLMRQGLFEAAAERYSAAIELVGDSEAVAPERRVCFSNRAGCRLQLRDYGSVIADCGEVLALDSRDVKALVRRGLAYEGLEKLTRASADVRTALSIEYASGGRLSNFGLMARQCLERCHRACPEVCPLTIPVIGPVGCSEDVAHASAVAVAQPACASKAVEPVCTPAAYTVQIEAKADHAAEAVQDQSSEVQKCTDSLKEESESMSSSVASSDHAQGQPPASSSTGQESLATRERRAEAEVLKTRGNEAFEAGRYEVAAMYYSGALDLVDNVPAYATNLAAAYVMLKDWQSALSAADRSLRMDEENPKAHYRRAQALEGLGRLEEAVAAFETGLAALPSSEALAKGLRAAKERLEARRTATDDALAQIRKKEAERKHRAAEESAAAAVSVAAAVASKPSPSPAASVNKGSVTTATPESSPFAVPTSGAEFRKCLRNVRRKPEAALAYLVLVGPERLAGLLAAGIEEEELVPVLQALDVHAQAGVDAADAFRLLDGVSQAGRVRIASAMLDRREAARLQALLLRLHPSKAGQVPYSVDDWARVRVALGV